MREKLLAADMQTTKSRRENICGKEYQIEEGQFWIQKQRQAHSMHYVVPYQACFAPQIPQFFIKNYSKSGDVVLDPFCGRGTTVLEANLGNRTGIGVDVSPLALTIARSKLKSITLAEVKKRLEDIDWSKGDDTGYEEFKHIYHKETYKQLRALQTQLGKNPVDTFIKTIVLGRLHGHSPSFFSVWTFNVISLSSERIKTQSNKRGTKPECRDIIPRIMKKAETVLRDPLPENTGSRVLDGNSQELPLSTNSVDLIVTSPPFLDVINYIDDNWLRFWFLGYDRERLRNVLVQTRNLTEYKDFILNSMKEMCRVLKPGKKCIIEVGDVRHKSKKIMLDHVIVELAEPAGFEVEKILINHINAPKISVAFGKNSKTGGTKTNRCVILKKNAR